MIDSSSTEDEFGDHCCRNRYYTNKLPVEKKHFYFVPSSEFNAYLKQIKAILSAVKNYRIFTSDEYDLYLQLLFF